MSTHVMGRRRRSADTVSAEAAAWIARLHGPDRTPELETGLRLWLAEDTRHRETFERMTQSWDDATAIVVRQQFPRMRRPLPAGRRNWAMAATVLALCGSGVFGVYGWLDRHTYATDIGEQRTVTLDDASKISVNSASKVVVSYGETAREVRLERGEALFEVAKDPARPFIVLAGNKRIEALGTSFVVRRDNDRTAVTLIDGRIAVSEAAPPRTLTPGQRLTFVAHKPAELDSPRMDAVTAWRRGEIVLEKMSLADAAAEMNRYDVNQLSVEDPQIAALKVSGIYRTGDNANFARVVARMYGLEVSGKGRKIQIGRRPSEH